MEIGLHGLPQPGDEWFWRDIGATWCKFGADVSVEQPMDQRAEMERARRMGLRIVVDLRTTSEWMSSVAMEAHFRLQQSGELQALEPQEPPAQDEGEADAAYQMRLGAWNDLRFQKEDIVVRHNQARTQQVAVDLVAERAARYVALHQDYCQDWEWWGEWDCPHTNQGIFHLIAYPRTLKAVHVALKQTQRDCRVWTGGNGMDLHDGWVIGLRQDDALKAFDVLNWHPYPMTMRDRGRIEEKLNTNYSEWRRMLDAEGSGQPYASTEWGYPSLRHVSRSQRDWLESNVVEGGISQLYPDEALEYYEGDLRLMERHGFQVVVVHMLRDSTSRHWGQKCGLLTVPAPGLLGKLPGPLRRRLEAKPVYRLVREWAWRGRAGKAAFA